ARSHVQQHALGVLEQLLHAHQEGHGLLAVHDAVIVGERHVHHRAHHHLIPYGDRTLLDLVHAEDAALGRVEDRRGKERTIASAVRNRERPARELVELERPLARPLGEPGELALDLGETQPVGIAHHRHHQAALGGDRDAHVDAPLVDDVGAANLGVELGNLVERDPAGAGEEAHEPEPHPVAPLEALAVALPDLEHRRHVGHWVGWAGAWAADEARAVASEGARSPSPAGTILDSRGKLVPVSVRAGAAAVASPGFETVVMAAFAPTAPPFDAAAPPAFAAAGSPADGAATGAAPGSMRAITSPTTTRSPGFRAWRSTPLSEAAISTAALSVSRVAIGSSTRTAAPSSLSHSTRTASEIDSASRGTWMSI